MNTWILLERTKFVLSQLYRQLGAPELSMLFDATELGAYMDQSPVLVTCAESSDLLKTVQQAPEGWPGLIIQSEYSTAVVLAHLRQMLFVRFEGRRRGVLRYSNPVTASYFFPACQATQLKLWLGPISRLSWYGGTWADHALSANRWQYLENADAKNRGVSAHEPVLEADQQQALQRQQQDRFLYLWWLKQSDLCYSRCQQWMNEGQLSGFTEADPLERYMSLRRTYPQSDLPPALPPGSDESRLAHLQQHLQKHRFGQES